MKTQAKKRAVAWVTGIPYWDLPESQVQQHPMYYNSIMATGDATEGLYKKQRLVPFGEYIPLSGLLSWVLPAMQNDPSMSGFSRGASEQKPLAIKQHHLGAAICYEVAYPNLTISNAGKSDFLVTVSNDASVYGYCRAVATFTNPQCVQRKWTLVYSGHQLHVRTTFF